MSIRYRLMFQLIILSSLLVGGGAWFAYGDIKHEARELFDAQLARSARLLLSLAQVDQEAVDFSSLQQHLNENQLTLDGSEFYFEDDDDKEELETGHIYETKLAFQIWNNKNELVLRSNNAPEYLITKQTAGFSFQTIEGKQWRVFSLQSKDKKYQCLTTERLDVRNDLISKISSDLFVFFVVLIPALSIVMWFAISHGLTPLQKLASQIDRRGAERLDSVQEDNQPSEIHTIAGALNQLLSRLKNALAREKRITSDAAHELRTPLAAVKLHAELAQKANNKEDRIESINQILHGIDRTTHLVEQLLALARLEPESPNTKPTKVSLDNIVIEETAHLSPFAHKKNIDLSINEKTTLTILGEDTSLRLLVRNLLNNAISYTHEGGNIEINLSRVDNKACFIIEDDGPGIPEKDRERVFERFYRAQNHESPGCGIGLSIVMRVVELYNATLYMDKPASGTGLKVTVCFPVD